MLTPLAQAGFLRAQLRVAWRIFTALTGVLLPFGLLSYLASCKVCDGWALSLLGNTLLFFLLLVLSMALHELAHALVGMAVGLRLHSIQLGAGHARWSWTLGKVQLSIAPLPLGALTQLVPVTRRWIRLKLWLTYAAGPLFHVVAVGSVLVLAPETLSKGLRGYSHELAPWTLMLHINAMLWVMNLLPYRANLGGASVMTDGARLLTTPFASGRDLDRIMESTKLLDAQRLLMAQRLEEALQLLPQREAAEPADVPPQLLRAVTLLELGRAEEGRALLLRLRAVPKLGRLFEALLDNAIAWSAILLEDDLWLADAESRSAAALAVGPDVPAFRNTRGSVLLRQGRVDEALPFLESAWRSTHEALPRAQVACMLAEAESHRGRLERAREWMRRATSLAPKVRLLAQIERRLKGGVSTAVDSQPGVSESKTSAA